MIEKRIYIYIHFYVKKFVGCLKMKEQQNKDHGMSRQFERENRPEPTSKRVIPIPGEISRDGFFFGTISECPLPPKKKSHINFLAPGRLIWVDQVYKWDVLCDVFQVFVLNENGRQNDRSSARATAENLETLEEELKTVMAKELENCGPHQAKMKEEMGEVGGSFVFFNPPRFGIILKRNLEYLQDVLVFFGGKRGGCFFSSLLISPMIVLEGL